MLFFSRILILKEAPSIIYNGLEKEIGYPRDIDKNLKRASYFY
jgi:hypothetical protein